MTVSPTARLAPQDVVRSVHHGSLRAVRARHLARRTVLFQVALHRPAGSSRGLVCSQLKCMP